MTTRRRTVHHRPEEPASGFLKGLTELIEKLGDLAESGRELRKSGELAPDDKLRAVYGLRVKLGMGGDAVDVEPFGNLKLDQKSRRVTVKEVREPLFDVIEEGGQIVVVAEMPGVSADDVSISIDGDVMRLEAVRGAKKYRREILLPRPVSPDKPKVACNNGIVEIRCKIK